MRVILRGAPFDIFTMVAAIEDEPVRQPATFIGSPACAASMAEMPFWSTSVGGKKLPNGRQQHVSTHYRWHQLPHGQSWNVPAARNARLINADDG